MLDTYYGAVVCLIWLADERSEVCNYFLRETHGERSSRQLSIALQFRITNDLFQRSHIRKMIKTHNDTGQTNKYSEQKYKNRQILSMFSHKITFYYVSTLSLPLSVSPSQTHIYCSLHTT